MTNSRDKNGGISNYRDGSNLPYGQTSPVSLIALRCREIRNTQEFSVANSVVFPPDVAFFCATLANKIYVADIEF